LPIEAEAALGKTLAALTATRGPIEIEWVFADGRMVYLQARPFEAPASPVSWLGFDDLPGDSAARALWRWDVAHNPLPLSPAQAGLVELVDGKCSVGIRQRVLGGYLFYALDQGALPPPIAAEAASEFFASLRAEVEVRLARLGARPDLEETLALFVFAYQPIFGVLQPALRQAHARLHAFLEHNAPAALGLLPVLRAGVDSMAGERRERSARIRSAGGQDKSARADYLALFGDEAPVWDVCAATYAEMPDGFLPGIASSESTALDWQGASAQVEAMLPLSLHEQWQHLLGVARTAVSLGEADDWLYARMQAAVRRALLGVGQRLHDAARLGEAEDVFFLSLALVRAPGVAPNLVALATAGRETWMRARRLPPPLPDALDNKAVRGTGTGGRAIGRVVWHRPGSHASTDDMVLVSRTLLPTELPLLSAIAIVSETGGLLDHVAAQARERGIPAVVGAHGAFSVFAEGDLVLVDGDAGLVVKIL
jgi:phosphohistidine swiveling domain-containing protein